MTSLPRSARWAAWFNAWIAGRVPLDDASVAVLGTDAAHDVVGLADETVGLVGAWPQLRRRGARLATVALPAPGDLAGLAGPPDFNESAVDAREAVILVGAGLGFVPSAVGSGVFWNAHVAYAPVPATDVSEAERALREQLIESGRELATLDVARWRPEIADALAGIREARDGVLPPGYDGRSQRVAALAERCLAIGELALTDEGASISLDEGTARRRSIESLSRAARHALVAACGGPHLS